MLHVRPISISCKPYKEIELWDMREKKTYSKTKYDRIKTS